jgi:opacity protein-like surface antigen
MIKLIACLLFSLSVFGQTENTTFINKTKNKDSVSEIIHLLGYQFYEGGFTSTKISNKLHLEFGLLHTNIDAYKIIEIPILLKQDFGNKFHAFFGSKFNVVINNGLSTLQFPDQASSNFGVSLELGLQYDVNQNFMLEMRYSLPINAQQSNYPSIMDFNSSGLFRLGSGYKF